MWVLLAGACAAQTVAEKAGQIWLKTTDGKATRLTASGRDSEAWITPDRSKVLFVRSDPGDMFRTSVYSVDTATRQESLLLAAPVRYRVNGQEEENAYIGEPRLGLNGHTLFVMSRESVTEGALLAVDLPGVIGRYIATAHSYDVILCGVHRGDLLLYQRKRSLSGNTYYYIYWLYRPQGEDLGIAGPDLMDTSGLMDQPCPAAPPDFAPGSAHRQQSGALHVPEQAMAQRLRLYVEPEYPLGMKASVVTGVVQMALQISAAGDVTDVKLVGGDPRLALAAMAAARQWKYHPWLVDGVPQAVVTTATVPFGATQ